MLFPKKRGTIPPRTVEMVMTQLILQEASLELAKAIDEVAAGEDHVIIEYQGKRIAAVSVDLLEWIEEIEDQIDREELERIRQEPSDSIPYEVFRKELGL